MINCFVRALRRRRPSIRVGLEAVGKDTDFQVTVWSETDSPATKPDAANCESGAANFSRYCNNVPGVTNSNFHTPGVGGSSRSIACRQARQASSKDSPKNSLIRAQLST